MIQLSSKNVGRQTDSAAPGSDSKEHEMEIFISGHSKCEIWNLHIKIPYHSR